MRKEIPVEEYRECPEFNQAPTGHKIPDGRSADDPSMAFNIPDCGVKAGGEFMSPFVLDDRDLPCGKNKQGF